MTGSNTAAGGPAPSYLDWLTAENTTTSDPAAGADTAASDLAVPAEPSEHHIASPGGQVTVVAGAHGGSGATITTLLLAMVAASESSASVIALDGTPVGGDLTTRAPAEHCHPSWWQHWLAGGDDPAADPSALPATGWTALGRDRSLGETASPLTGVVSALASPTRSVIVDAGASVGSPWFDSAADLADHIIVTIDDRPGAANASRPVLSMLRRRLGTEEMGRTVHLVVTSQRPGVDHVTGPLADALSGRVAGVHHLPYDSEIAAGVGIDPSLLSPRSFTIAHHIHTSTSTSREATTP
ncbi:MinD/ParA family ATP-binding protein [Rhodococcoides fascians]|uniref:MinD/ParA family ATP-binding protein n=1 Tax=Rhodococcoides fascians TaxID=1828 RepID=UPI0005619BD5|nr:hypothetical protein [Rhodococcus fascians]